MQDGDREEFMRELKLRALETIAGCLVGIPHYRQTTTEAKISAVLIGVGLLRYDANGELQKA